MIGKARARWAAKLLVVLLAFNLLNFSAGYAQRKVVIKQKGDTLVNQAGYNLGEAKRLTANRQMTVSYGYLGFEKKAALSLK